MSADASSTNSKQPALWPWLVPLGLLASLVWLGIDVRMLRPLQANEGGSASSPALIERGGRLFNGLDALRGTLEGHERALSAGSTHCSLCHVNKPLSTSVQFAPPLGQRYLLDLQERRGGPASAYSLGTFCYALRAGVDPAHVTLPRAMPRFHLDDAECSALWAYVLESR